MSATGEAYIKALNDEEDKRLSKQMPMIDKPRLAELRAVSLKEYRPLKTSERWDLDSILSDYEAAMPLLETAKETKIDEHALWNSDIAQLLDEVIKYQGTLRAKESPDD